MAQALIAEGRVLVNGEVEFRATYQAVTGTLRLLVGQAPPLRTFVLSGTVREAGTETVLPGARIAVSGGSISGALATSDVNGRFSFSSLPTGSLAVEATKDGYLTPLNATVMISEDTNLDVWMFAIVPLDADARRGLRQSERDCLSHLSGASLLDRCQCRGPSEVLSTLSHRSARKEGWCFWSPFVITRGLASRTRRRRDARRSRALPYRSHGRNNSRSS